MLSRRKKSNKHWCSACTKRISLQLGSVYDISRDDRYITNWVCSKCSLDKKKFLSFYFILFRSYSPVSEKGPLSRVVSYFLAVVYYLLLFEFVPTTFLKAERM